VTGLPVPAASSGRSVAVDAGRVTSARTEALREEVRRRPVPPLALGMKPAGNVAVTAAEPLSVPVGRPH
jgi:hypothetical protein